MVNDETKRKLRELNLSEFVAALEFQQSDINNAALSFDNRIQRLVDYLYQEKYNNKIQRLMRMSKFRLPKAEVINIYYSGRGISQSLMQCRSYPRASLSGITQTLFSKDLPARVKLFSPARSEGRLARNR